jgi:SAM-dependent methyltransferase
MKIINLLTKNQIDDINKLLKSYNKKPNSSDEFEISLFSNRETSNHLLTLEKFNNLNSILSIITSKNEEKYKKHTSQELDVNMTVRNLEDNKLIVYRITINELNKINEYMKMLHMRKNHLVFSVLMGFIMDKKSETERTNVSVMKKTKNISNYITLEDYYMRIKLDNEENLTPDEMKKLLKINSNFDVNTYNIMYRFKERTSYYIVKEKNVYRIDLTKVRTSSHINEIEKNLFDYEIEIECEIKDKTTIMDEVLNICEFIIKSIQSSNYIITKTKSDEVLNKYREIVEASATKTNLHARQPISLEIQHLVDQLPNKYAVTDKADGDRNFLIMYENRCYLISTNLIVKDTGIEVDTKLNNTILDGEYIFIAKYNKYLFMGFDCLRYGEENIQNEIKFMNRLDYLDKVIESINKTKYKSKKLLDSKIDINNIDKILDFHRNNLIELYDDIDNELKSKTTNIIFRRKYFMDCIGIKDNEIFKYSNFIWNNYINNSKLKCPYHLDGLIYHPLDQKYIIDPSKSKYSEYKWKPPTQNSIDFYIEFEKDKNTGKILKVYDNSINDKIKNKPYVICNLYVGQKTKGIEKPVLFGFNEGIHQAYLYLEDDGSLRTQDGKQITDNTVVEFYYNLEDDLQIGYRWIPMKTRYDKTESVNKYKTRYGNNYEVALKIWRSITNPIKMSDFTTLSDDKLYDKYFKELQGKIDFNVIKLEKKENIYFQKKTDLIKDMGAFHNWIKSNIIYTYVNHIYDDIRKSVLDIACGKGQDIQKFYYSEVKLYVGIDSSLDALTNSSDGAIARYKNQKKMHDRFPPCYFINADASILLQYEEQVKKIGNMSNDNQKLFNKFFSEETAITDRSIKFDIVNCQFALHYLLSDELTWKNNTENIKMYLREGGYFMFTVFDGDIIKDKLKGVDKYTEYYDDNGEQQILFEIVKKYDDKNNAKLGLGIDVHMGWMFEDGVYQTEYLVFKDFIIESLRDNCDLELVETYLFKDMFNDNREFLKLSSDVEEDVKRAKFFKNVYKYYTSSEINQKCYNYTFLSRMYIFRKKETNLSEIKKKYYTEKYVKPSKTFKKSNFNRVTKVK